MKSLRNLVFGRVLREGHIWLPGYLSGRLSRWGEKPCRRAWILFADHYEPRWRRAEMEVAVSRVQTWFKHWPALASQHEDSAGRPPLYTFFYPQEEYSASLLDPLAEMTHSGIGDVEVHLHHDGEGEQDFLDRMSGFLETLEQRHGLLRRHNGKLKFGFIHGNWALDNSGSGGRHCGLNNELLLLKRLGCYADFTFPSVPDVSQPRLVNTIYWATDDPQQPKSHDTGVMVRPGSAVSGDLLMVPGPLGLNFRGGRLLPRIETGELAALNPVTPERVRLWLKVAPRIGEDVFIKLFAHGAPESNAEALLTRDLPTVFRELRRVSAEQGMAFYFVSAWQMRQVIDALSQEKDPPGVLHRTAVAGMARREA